MDIMTILAISSGLIVLLLLALLWQLRRPAADPRALTDLAVAEDRAASLRAELESLRGELESAHAARLEAEKQAASLRSELAVKTQAFEKLAETATQAARAAAVESAAQLSNKLLADHKREAEAQKEEAEKRVKQTTEGLFQKFTDVSGLVAGLAAQLQDRNSRVDAMYRMLSHPGGAGRMAEIGLENTLKAFGLQPGHDFLVQYHAAGDAERGALRPDAVVFLPGDAVLVIDSKASKLLLDLAEAEGVEAEAAALAQLKQRMNAHLRALSGKDYGNAVLATYRETKRGGALRRSMTAMMLPNDAAVEKLRIADPDFERRAAECDIVVAGPSALAAIIAVSRLQIDSGRQAENLEKIVEAVTALIESTATALTLAEKVGKGLQTATEQFESFSRSVNARLLPRVRRLAQFGIRPAKAPPAALPSFAVNVTRSDVIEAEVEEVPLLPDQGRGQA
ncbi:MAG TPA: DNA recombination protein RmuC [Ferrovibrio sp.]|nr:DNA recombination protein RmuC [Ferrovibrio sp.]